jgi:transcriptional regulator with XRE-family HTH domain
MKRQNGMSAEQGRRVSEQVLEELARRRMSRAALAAASKLSLSTLEKVLSGRRALTLATAVRLEEALGVRLRQVESGAVTEPPPTAAASAPDELGGYARTAVAWLEGSYLTLRPSLSGQGAVYAYRTDISWNAPRCVLTFREAERLDTDFTQFGDVAVPHQSGHIYLVTNRHGQHRLVVLTRPTITGELHGLVTTLQAGRGSHLSPVSMPVVLQPIKAGPSPEFGRIAQGHPAFRGYSGLLRKTLGDHYAHFLTM